MQLTFESADDLAEAMKRAAAAHGVHEQETGKPDPGWPDWYAHFLEKEQADQRAGRK